MISSASKRLLLVTFFAFSSSIFYAVSGGYTNKASDEKVGEEIEEYVCEQVFDMCQNNDSLTRATLNRIKDKVAQKLQKGNVRYEKYQMVLKKATIDFVLKEEILKLVCANTDEYFNTHARYSSSRASVVEQITRDVNKLISSGNFDLTKFTGNKLADRINNYVQEESGKQKKIAIAKRDARCLEYAFTYFSPSKTATMESLDTAYQGNINAVANKAIELLGNNTNPTEQQIRNAMIDAIEGHVSRSAYQYAKRKGHSELVANQVAAKILSQLQNRINGNNIRNRDLNTSLSGMFKDYITERLEKEINTIV